MPPDSSLKFRLPTELWLHIFRIATTTPDFNRLQGTKYYPFQNPSRIHPEPKSQVEELVWKTKMNLMLVCRQWNKIVLEYVYENIHIGDHWQSLLDVLERSAHETDGLGYGQLVKRISLSAWLVEADATKLGEIMKWCPNAEVLVKRDDDITATPTSELHLSSLKRFDWWYTTCRETRIPIYPANFSQGRDLFRSIVAQASNLLYLSIGIRYPMSRTSDHPPMALTLDHLTVLRVQHIGSLLREELEGWSFPKLTHIIADSSLTWNTDSPLFSPQIEVIEFVKDETLETLSALGVINNCTNLRELNYHIEFARFPLRLGTTPKLQCVRLHGGKNFMLHFDGSDVWGIYEHHFRMFANEELFPALRNIFLHGDWTYIDTDPRFDQMVKTVVSRGCQVSYSYGRRIEPNSNRGLKESA